MARPDPMLDWWLAPLSGATDHVIAAPVAWHARLMVLAWGVLIPVGVLWARFWKVAPRPGLAAANSTTSAGGTRTARCRSAVSWSGLGRAGAGLSPRRRDPGRRGRTTCSAGPWSRRARGRWRTASPAAARAARRRRRCAGDHYDMTPVARVLRADPQVARLGRRWSAPSPRSRRASSPPTRRAGWWRRIAAWWLLLGARFRALAAGRPRARHLPGDLGARPGAAGQRAGADRLGRDPARSRLEERRRQAMTAGLELSGVTKRFGESTDRPGHRPRREPGRVHRPGRRVGLRQVHDPAHDRGPRDRDRGPDLDRGPRRHERASRPARHRDGVPELRALPAHVGAPRT